jgi:hypothetical protein
MGVLYLSIISRRVKQEAYEYAGSGCVEGNCVGIEAPELQRNCTPRRNIFQPFYHDRLQDRKGINPGAVTCQESLYP